MAQLWSRTMGLPPRQRIVRLARPMMGARYRYGAREGRPSDAIGGGAFERSGFVRNVFDQVFPATGLSSHSSGCRATANPVRRFRRWKGL
jgi:hypothetical protein